MTRLARWGYVGLSLQQALIGLSDGARQGQRVVALTFDDGYRDFQEQAWPILRQLGFGATLFVVADRVGGRADWAGGSSALLLDWDALGWLAEAGVEIGAHGLDHRPLDQLSAPGLTRSLADQQSILLHRLGQAPCGLAYPYGRWSTAAAAAARQAGFSYAATTRGGKNDERTPLFKLRRTLVRPASGQRLALLRFALLVRSGYADIIDWLMDLRRIP